MKDNMRDPNQKVSVRADGSIDVATHNSEPSMTQQQFKDECDINNIMDKYIKTGEFLSKTSKLGQYADFSNIQDYQEMLHTVQYAQDAFASLPAQVRTKFNNDPGELLTFLQDDKNYDEGVKLGLLNERPLPTTPLTPKSNDLNEPKPSNQPNKTKNKTDLES